MKRLLIVLFVLIPISISAQTLHTIMMCNKNDRTLARGNEGEVKEMQYLIPTLAAKLGFKSNFVVHSGIEFTYTILNQEISNLNVSDGDIVIFYYASHGVNWSDSEWPHMAFLDRQYGETTIYNKLREKFGNAKLILCISDCCNMDSEGTRREKRTYSGFDPALTKKLFTDFEGHRSYEISASIRGQYSYSNRQYGALFGIALREAVSSALTGKTQPNWVYVLEKAKSLTLELTNQEQMPQFKMNRW